MIIKTDDMKVNPKGLINKIHIVINLGVIISALILMILNLVFNNNVVISYMSISLLLSVLGLCLGGILLKFDVNKDFFDNLLILMTTVAIVVLSFAYFSSLELISGHLNGFIMVTCISHIIIFFLVRFNSLLSFNRFKNLDSELQGYLIGGGGTLIVYMVSNYYSNEYYNGSFIPIISGFMYLIAVGYSTFLAAKLFLLKKEK